MAQKWLIITDFIWRVSDCEELEGVTHGRAMGLVIFESIKTINYCKLVVYDLEGNSSII